MEGSAMTKIKPFINIGPGNIIKRNLEALNWSQRDLAEITGLAEKTVSQILNNKQPITIETSLLLGRSFNTSPEFWLSLDQNYRLRLKTESSKEKETEIKAEIRKHMPIIEMRKKRWISCDKFFRSQQKAFLNFWGIKKLDFSMYDDNNLQYCPRQSKVDETYTIYYTLTWLQKARLVAKEKKLAKFDKKKLGELIIKIPEYSRAENGVERFIEALNDAGVIFFVLSHLSKTYLDGACFSEGNNPVIVYTARHDRADNFWFTMAHEIAHVLLHLNKKSDCFIDDLDKKTDNVKESQADKLAAKHLKIDEILKEALPHKNYFSEIRLIQLSEKFKIHPSLAIGILQYSGIVDYRKLNRHKIKVMDKIPEKYIAG
jgi:HTH-type transcriptional regulator/antitoxin HigA